MDRVTPVALFHAHARLESRGPGGGLFGSF
jgi:hypothetical protein